jgi:hypothetical protein
MGFAIRSSPISVGAFVLCATYFCVIYLLRNARVGSALRA